MLALSGAPPAVGVNVTAIVHDEFGDTRRCEVPPVTAKSLAFGPLVMLSLTDSVKPDRLVTVTSLVFVGTLAVRVPIRERGRRGDGRRDRRAGGDRNGVRTRADRDCRSPSASPIQFPARSARRSR